MKQLLIAFLFIPCFCKAQDSTKDTVAIISPLDVVRLANDIQTQAEGKADIKKEEWYYILQMLQKSVIIRTLPNKEKTQK